METIIVVTTIASFVLVVAVNLVASINAGDKE